ncbi:MAG TPA: hypothetical protein VHB46_01725 [Burkholderiales bacterium]|nr:hypothetical protein [Burkholderiales bacterium]
MLRLKITFIIFLSATAIFCIGCTPGSKWGGTHLSSESKYEKNRKLLIDEYGEPPPKGYQPIGPLPAQIDTRVASAPTALTSDDTSEKNQESTVQTIEKSIASCTNLNQWFLSSLPSEAVRLAIGQTDISGNISYGPFTALRKEGSYVVVLDYIKFQTQSLNARLIEALPSEFATAQRAYRLATLNRDNAQDNLFRVRRSYEEKKRAYDPFDAREAQKAIEESQTALVAADKAANDAIDRFVVSFTQYKKTAVPYWARSSELQVLPKGKAQPAFANRETNSEEYLFNTSFVSIPIYVGVGVRMIAAVTVLDTSVELGSLYSLAVAAQNKQLQGTLVVQTLGLSGEGISPLVPLPGEINVSTIQNAIQALATIKSKVYETGRGKVEVTPVVVGIDDYIGRPETKEQLVSGLYAHLDDIKLQLDPGGCPSVSH